MTTTTPGDLIRAARGLLIDDISRVADALQADVSEWFLEPLDVATS